MKQISVLVCAVVALATVAGCSQESTGASVTPSPTPPVQTGFAATPLPQVSPKREVGSGDNIEVITKNVVDSKAPGVRPNLLVGDNGAPWSPPEGDWKAAIKEREEKDFEGAVAVYGWRKMSDFHRKRIKEQYLRVMDVKLL